MIRASVGVLMFGALFSASVFAEQNAVAADGSIWQPSKDCSLSMRDGEFIVTSTGNDPYIVSADLPAMKGPFTVELRMKSNSRGPAQIYWAPRENKDGFAANRSVTFGVLHDNEWHDYVARIDAAEIGRFRLDPSTAPGESRIASVRIKDSMGDVAKEWKFGNHGTVKDFPNSKGDAQIRGVYKDSEIVITTTARLAGAIHSLTWRGQEFVNSADHGRQLQSATNLDYGTPIHAETFNPTEAGSRDDGAGPFSTSRLLGISANGPELKTTIQMAFWLRPGEKSGGVLAKNTSDLSNHLISKRVHIGHKDMPNVIEYDTTFTVPNEHHTQLVIEAVTGYMPPEFKNFQKRDPATGELSTVTDGPGEQPWPLVFSSETGSHAMGIFAPAAQPGGREKPAYGRFRFAGDKVVKWNCVFRNADKNGIKPGEYSYRAFVVIGTVEDVKTAMNALAKEFGG